MWNHIKIVRFIKKIIPFRLRILLIRILFYVQYNYSKIVKASIDIKEKNIYFMLSTDYSNLGDHAMSYASLKLLKDTFPEYNIIEITVNDTLKYLLDIKRKIKNHDFIVLKGGGNIGVQYFREELIRRKIIKLFSENKIYIFPQTVYFPDTKLGNKEFNKTIDIYNSNKNLLTILRDEISYESVKDKLHNIYLCPDIVFYLEKLFSNKITSNERKQHISICMRSDVEGIYNNDFKYNLKKIIFITTHKNIQEFDTIKPYKIDIVDRKKELLNILQQISTSKLVITDRLHGMIFCYLLKVPCIVLRTYNFKVFAQYKWIRNANFIEFCDDNSIDNIVSIMNNLLSIKLLSKNNDFYNYFENLKKLLIKNLGDL